MTSPLPRSLVLATCLAAALAAPLGVGAGPRVAHADDGDTRAARRAFERGEKLFALGKFDEALEAYQAAYDAKPLAAFLFNIGQCHRNLGDYEAAIFSFRKYLKAAPDAENRDQVEAYIEELEAEQERASTRKFGLDPRPPREPAPAAPAARPVYTRWWFWTGLAVVGAAGGAGLYLATRGDDAPPTTLGNIVFTK